jgi:hypothetical protein
MFVMYASLKQPVEAREDAEAEFQSLISPLSLRTAGKVIY